MQHSHASSAYHSQIPTEHLPSTLLSQHCSCPIVIMWFELCKWFHFRLHFLLEKACISLHPTIFKYKNTEVSFTALVLQLLSWKSKKCFQSLICAYTFTTNDVHEMKKTLKKTCIKKQSTHVCRMLSYCSSPRRVIYHSTVLICEIFFFLSQMVGAFLLLLFIYFLADK